MDNHTKELIERGVSALERLADDPVIEMETGPPICPNCQKMNPKVRVSESEAEGPLAEIVIQAHCLSCDQVFYAIPIHYECLKTMEEAGQLMEMKVRAGGFNGRED